MFVGLGKSTAHFEALATWFVVQQDWHGPYFSLDITEIMIGSSRLFSFASLVGPSFSKSTNRVATIYN